MISQTVLNTIKQFVPEENIRFEEPMNRHTTFKIGGTADCFIEITDGTDLAKLLSCLHKEHVPFFVMGNGSNVLVSDKGYRGIILHIADSFGKITVNGEKMEVNAGASLAKVARVALEKGLTGFEFAAGIPGTIGGAVMMNAGAYGGEMKQVVESVDVIDDKGQRLCLSKDAMEFAYRSSIVKKKNYTVTGCTLRLQPQNPEEIREKMEEFSKSRREKQPLEYPSAGSTFKRPEGYFAGKLIMDAGLRGFQVGGARVSDKHCGFVINTGNATAEDVRRLISRVTEIVYKKFKVHLEPEIIFLGEF